MRINLKDFFTRKTVTILVFSLVQSVAFELAALSSQDFSSRRLFSLSGLIDLAIYFIALSLINYFIFWLLDYFLSQKRRRPQKTPKTPHFHLKTFLLYWLIIMLCWLPVFLAYYPGLWSYDVDHQIGEYTAHHPLIHTFFLNFFVHFIGDATGNYNFAIATATAVQMLGMSGIFAFACAKLKTFNVPRGIIYLILAFAAIMPFNSLLAVSATKDTLFAGFLVLVIILLYEVVFQPTPSTKWRYIALAAALCLFMLFRNNGTIVVLALLPFIILCSPRKIRRPIILTIMSSIVVVVVLQGVMVKITNATDGQKLAALSVPAQQLATVVNNHPDIIPAYGEGATMLGNIERDKLPENFSRFYNKTLVDPVKEAWGEASELSQANIIKAWLKNAWTYKFEYIDAWIKLMSSSWYLPNSSYADIYKEVSPSANGYLETTFFLKLNKMPGARPNSKLPPLQSYLDRLFHENDYRNNPILYFILSPAVYIWMLCLLVAYLIYRRQYEIIILPILPLLLYCTVLLGPCVLIRYTYPIMCSTPFIIALSLHRVRNIPRTKSPRLSKSNKK